MISDLPVTHEQGGDRNHRHREHESADPERGKSERRPYQPP
jgi:hypothetical protein